MTPRGPDFQEDQVISGDQDLFIFISTGYHLVDCVWAASLEILIYSHTQFNAEADALKVTYSLKNLRELRRKGAAFLL